MKHTHMTLYIYNFKNKKKSQTKNTCFYAIWHLLFMWHNSIGKNNLNALLFPVVRFIEKKLCNRKENIHYVSIIVFWCSLERLAYLFANNVIPFWKVESGKLTGNVPIGWINRSSRYKFPSSLLINCLFVVNE